MLLAIVIFVIVPLIVVYTFAFIENRPKKPLHRKYITFTSDFVNYDDKYMRLQSNIRTFLHFILFMEHSFNQIRFDSKKIRNLELFKFLTDDPRDDPLGVPGVDKFFKYISLLRLISENGTNIYEQCIRSVNSAVTRETKEYLIKNMMYFLLCVWHSKSTTRPDPVFLKNFFLLAADLGFTTNQMNEIVDSLDKKRVKALKQ
ncbi:MAG: hypothetical protein PHW02_04395 [bacterium]|nr:hypothetical protein [bacterium]